MMGNTELMYDCLLHEIQVDTDNHCLRTINMSTGVVTTLAGGSNSSGFADGLGSMAQFAVAFGGDVDAHATFALVVRLMERSPVMNCCGANPRCISPPPTRLTLEIILLDKSSYRHHPRLPR